MQNNQKELILLEDLGMHYPNETSNKKVRYGIYKCYCGNEFKTRIQSVKQNKTKSCGCLHKEKALIFNTKHGLSSHVLFGTWSGMIQRCTNKIHMYYNDYGARGITVCDRWLNVANFIEDMLPTFQKGLTLDRKDNDRGYSKDNCRWVENKIQHRNTRKIRSTNTSGYRGVSFYNLCNKWYSRICVDYKNIYLGRFNTAIEAARAYDDYIIKNNLEHTRNFA